MDVAMPHSTIIIDWEGGSGEERREKKRKKERSHH